MKIEAQDQRNGSCEEWQVHSNHKRLQLRHQRQQFLQSAFPIWKWGCESRKQDWKMRHVGIVLMLNSSSSMGGNEEICWGSLRAKSMFPREWESLPSNKWDEIEFVWVLSWGLQSLTWVEKSQIWVAKLLIFLMCKTRKVKVVAGMFDNWSKLWKSQVKLRQMPM